MALVKCKECGHEMSSEAAACPSCGKPKPKETSRFTIAVFCLVAFGLVKCAYDASNASEPPAAHEKTQAEIQADRELNAAIAVGRALKASAKDPSSFKMESFLIFPGGNACYEYRAKNSFGAIVPAKAVYAQGVPLTSEHDGNRFVRAWNAVCTKPGGRERAGGLNLLGVW